MSITMLSVLAALAASSSPAPVGQIAEGDGAVMVMRADQSEAAMSGDVVFEGDRVIAKTGSAATVRAFGCDTEVSELGLVTVAPEMCGETSQISFGAAQAGAGWAGLSDATKTLIFFGGAAGTVAIVDAVVTDDDEPASP